MNENMQRKHQIVDEIHEKFQASSLLILAEYRGVDVAGMNDLRRRAREANVQVRVMKNSLARRAVENTHYECLKEQFLGPLAIALSEDPVAVAKLLDDFEKSNEHFKIQCGAMNGTELTPDELKVLATLPSREELLAKLLGTLNAPMQQFVTTLHQIPSKLLRTLAAIRDSKES